MDYPERTMCDCCSQPTQPPQQPPSSDLDSRVTTHEPSPPVPRRSHQEERVPEHAALSGTIPSANDTNAPATEVLNSTLVSSVQSTSREMTTTKTPPKQTPPRTPQKHYVRTTPGSGALKSPVASQVISPHDTYEVIGETKTTYHLSNIRTGIKIAGGTAGNLKLMKSWFADAEEPTEEDRDRTNETPEPLGDYKLRTPLPSAQDVWESCGFVDKYTGLSRHWYTDNKTTTDVDHVFEVQSANRMMLLKFPFVNGQPDSRTSEVVECTRDYLRSLQNLNNTDSGLNRWWKGVAVKDWLSRYNQARVTGIRLRSEYDGLASVLRDRMRDATLKMRDPTSPHHWLQAAQVFKGKGLMVMNGVDVDSSLSSSNPTARKKTTDNTLPPPPPLPPTIDPILQYAPNYARNICREMGRSSYKLVDRLHDHDGEAFLDYSEALRDMIKAMDLPGAS